MSKRNGKGSKKRLKKLPKTECCVSSPRCKRCPIRLLRDGRLPEGYAVKKRVLVGPNGKKAQKKELRRAA